MKNLKSKIASSFRDPSGFIFVNDGEIYRQVNLSYKNNYDFLESSGLLKKLMKDYLLINHEEIKEEVESQGAYKIIKPTKIPFISYPYEWCFSELKDAALLTLKIQKTALDFGMTLKDASAYNIQFISGKPIFIDTLSFEKYSSGSPWIGYRQFCQHFLAPLALMSHTDLRLSGLIKNYIDGIPLDLAQKLLPFKTRFSLGLGTHIHLHSGSQKNNADDFSKPKYNLPKNQMLGIIDNLESTVKSLSLPNAKTTWQNYYSDTNYSPAAEKHKKNIIEYWIKKISPKSIWDAGANNGEYSLFGSKNKILTISTDFDPMAIEQSYITSKKNNDAYILPLVVDLVNPSPSIGWANSERESFLERAKFDLTMALALIHHLAIANNLPLANISELFKNQTNKLIIEFVPKDDTNTLKLLKNREDIFPTYNESEFEKEFSLYFDIKEKVKITDSKRTLYLMQKKI